MYHKNFSKQILLGYLGQLRQNVKDMEHSKNTEALHQARVNARRLRMSISLFKEQFAARDVRPCRKELRKLEKALGPARDLDTEILFLTALSSRIQAPGLVRGTHQLLAQLHQERAQLEPQVRAAVRSIKKKKTLKRLDRTMQQVPDYMPAQELAQLLAKGRRKIQKRLDTMRSFEKHVSRPDKMNKLHDLRIAAKYLRYTLEAFKPFYSVTMDRFIASAHAVQNTLGDFHDAQVWAASLAGREARAARKKDLREGIKHFKNSCEKSQRPKYHRFVVVWESFKKEKVWDNLVKYLSAFTPAT